MRQWLLDFCPHPQSEKQGINTTAMLENELGKHTNNNNETEPILLKASELISKARSGMPEKAGGAPVAEAREAAAAVDVETEGVAMMRRTTTARPVAGMAINLHLRLHKMRGRKRTVKEIEEQLIAEFGDEVWDRNKRHISEMMAQVGGGRWLGGPCVSTCGQVNVLPC